MPFAIVSYASNNQWSTGKTTGEKLFPSLVSDASQIATIEVRQGDNTVVLETQRAAVVVIEIRDGFPADPARVCTLLVGLAEADLVGSQDAPALTAMACWSWRTPPRKAPSRAWCA